MVFRTASIGTTWSLASSEDGLGSGIQNSEFVSIESVTVPYGSFATAFVHRSYFDPDNPALSNTPLLV